MPINKPRWDHKMVAISPSQFYGDTMRKEHAMRIQQILLFTLVCSVLLITATTASMAAAASDKNSLTTRDGNNYDQAL